MTFPKKPRKKRTVTDKERLDWLTKQGQDLCFHYKGWFVTGHIVPGANQAKSPRAAIDAAIRAERKLWS